MKTLFASILFLLSASAAVSAATDALQATRLPCLSCSRDQLEGWCGQNGGIFFPPGTGGAYACLLPDGSLVACGGTIPICTQSRIVSEAPVWDLASIIAMQERLLATIRTLEERVGALEERLKKLEGEQR